VSRTRVSLFVFCLAVAGVAQAQSNDRFRVTVVLYPGDDLQALSARLAATYRLRVDPDPPDPTSEPPEPPS
jgi:hypothetical protein